MNKTNIEWVKNPDGTQGYTWNPITGCLNGCEYCYARKLANGRLKERYLANKNAAPAKGNVLLPNLGFVEMNPFYPRFWPERLKELNPTGVALMVPWSKDRGIFICDMSDLFGIGIPEDWTQQVLAEIKQYSWHRFYLLTKQPQNLIKFSPFPDNCWVGVSCSDEIMLTKAYSPLKAIQAKVKYISFEPLLNSDMSVVDLEWTLRDIGISWVIIGAQTKPYKPPKIEWVEEITEVCGKAGVPVFLKDNLKPLLRAGGWKIGEHKWITWLRQEMPKAI